MRRKLQKLLKKHKDNVDVQVIEVINIEDEHEKIVCNIHDFVGWCETVGALRKPVLSQIELYANFFVAYHSYINLRHREDTPEYRLEWFKKYKEKIILRNMEKGGLGF